MVLMVYYLLIIRSIVRLLGGCLSGGALGKLSTSNHQLRVLLDYLGVFEWLGWRYYCY